MNDSTNPVVQKLFAASESFAQDKPERTQHTPGPWSITEQGAIVRGNWNGDTIVYTINGESAINGKANARLIAAAPETAKERDELLKTARLVEARSHVNADGSYTVDSSAMDAICKVLGKSIRRIKAEGRAE